MEQERDFQFGSEPQAEQPNSAQKGGRKSRFAVLTISAFALLFAAIGGLIFARKLQEDDLLRLSIIQSQEFAEGIYINGVHVGGLRTQEAVIALQDSHMQYLEDISFLLSYEEGVFPVDAYTLGMTSNVEQVLQEAFVLGRRGTLEEIQQERQALAANPRHFTLSYAPDEEKIAAFAQSLALLVNRPPTDASFASLVDPKAASEEERKTAEYVNLAATRQPADCYSYAEGEDGYDLDQPALVSLLLEKVAAGVYNDLELPLTITQSNVRWEDVQGTTTLRGKAFTSFAKSPYNRDTRVFNIKKAVGLINGTVLQPGEVFSTNDTLGNRTYGAGWKPAPAIVRGRSEDQAGGGVCQVSSTLYNCVLKSDLEIVYRQGHSGRLSYVDGGLDATIDSGRIDFKWKNSTSSPIYIFAYVDEKKKEVHFEIHGEPFPDTFDEIQLSSKKVSGISPPGPMQYTVDYSKPAGYSNVYIARKSGSLWEAYATYLKNGEVVKKLTLDRTTYKAYAGETIVGPSAAGVPTAY